MLNQFNNHYQWKTIKIEERQQLIYSSAYIYIYIDREISIYIDKQPKYDKLKWGKSASAYTNKMQWYMLFMEIMGSS